MVRLLPLLLFLVAGCSGISGTNVGVPTPTAKRLFLEKLALVHPGMPADSLTLLCAKAEKPGETGILFRSRMITEEFSRETLKLGWKSEPKHQGEFKSLSEIDQVRAVVETQDGLVLRIRKPSRVLKN